MAEESSKILAMVADGKITADEAAKLLKALNGQDRGGKPREIKITKIMAGRRPETLHGHMDGCHCVSVCEDGGINIWRERSEHVG